jgi:hypothetical protein
MKQAVTTAGYVWVLAIFATVTNAQSRPDFSGAWKPVENPTSTSSPLPPPKPGGPPPPPRTLSTTIAQSVTELKVDRRVERDGGEAVITFIYKLDGTESLNQMGPIVFKTKAAWDGATLVLSSVISIDERTIGESKDIYRLEDGQLIVETTRQTPAGTFRSRDVNRKG